MRGSPNHDLWSQLDQTAYHDIVWSLNLVVDPDLAYADVYDPVLYSSIQELEFVLWGIPTLIESARFQVPPSMVHAYIRASVRG